MSIIRSIKKVFIPSLHVTLVLVLHHTALYIPYLCGYKITPHVTWTAVTIEEFFHNIVPGPCPLIQISAD